MKLLILTQKVDINDDVLGFMHGWIAEFAKHCESVIVICLQKGEYNLPRNVKVLSLGKEGGRSRLKYLWRFYKYICLERKNYDTVFVHMNQIYIVLGGVFWKIFNKRLTLWYVHKSVNLKLKLAEKLADKIFTASKESFQLKSKKIIITGHGIDINKFKPQKLNFNKDSKLKIIYVSRISKIKNQEMLIRAIDILVNKKNFKNLEVCLVGAPATPPDRPYLESLKDLITEFNLNNYIKFLGKIPNKDIVKYYNESNLSVDLCPTGGVDKVVLESMACGVPAIVLNKTFVPILAAYQKELILTKDDPQELADKIFNFYFFDKSFMEKIKKELRDKIIKLFNLEEIIKKIITEL